MKAMFKASRNNKKLDQLIKDVDSRQSFERWNWSSGLSTLERTANLSWMERRYIVLSGEEQHGKAKDVKLQTLIFGLP